MNNRISLRQEPFSLTLIPVVLLCFLVVSEIEIIPWHNLLLSGSECEMAWHLAEERLIIFIVGTTGKQGENEPFAKFSHTSNF